MWRIVCIVMLECCFCCATLTNEWASLSNFLDQLSLPTGVAGAACAHDSSSHKLYYFGGYSDTNGYSTNVYKLDWSTLEWVELVSNTSQMISRGILYRGTMYKDSYWSFGIYGSSSVRDNKIYIFNLTTESWTVLPSVNSSSDGIGNVSDTSDIPKIPYDSSQNCAVYDTNKHIFWVMGTRYDNDASKKFYLKVFNLTRYENGDYKNVWQFDINGVSFINFNDSINSTTGSTRYIPQMNLWNGCAIETIDNNTWIYVIGGGTKSAKLPTNKIYQLRL